ncbi:MAG TPA: hypothetical protein VG318_09505 [Actinomycetota bacterium]|nr:hypothetical protein [Actinomycetota bacterium]
MSVLLRLAPFVATAWLYYEGFQRTFAAERNESSDTWGLVGPLLVASLTPLAAAGSNSSNDNLLIGAAVICVVAGIVSASLLLDRGLYSLKRRVVVRGWRPKALAWRHVLLGLGLFLIGLSAGVSLYAGST